MSAWVTNPMTRKPAPAPMPEYRCSCGRLLVRGDLKPGSSVEAFCDRCKRHVLIVAGK